MPPVPIAMQNLTTTQDEIDNMRKRTRLPVDRTVHKQLRSS